MLATLAAKLLAACRRLDAITRAEADLDGRALAAYREAIEEVESAIAALNGAMSDA